MFSHFFHIVHLYIAIDHFMTEVLCLCVYVHVFFRSSTYVCACDNVVISPFLVVLLDVESLILLQLCVCVCVRVCMCVSE